MKTEEKFDISSFSPCSEGKAYYDSKPSFEAFWNECERGDWMLWIAHKLDIDRRTLIRAKALCANTVRHLMKDKRSTDAIDAALLYADGKITEKELDAAAARAAAARAAAAADVAHAHAHAHADVAYAHADVAYADAYAAYAAARAAAAAAAADDDDATYVATAAYVAYAYAAYAATHAASTRAIEAAIEATNAAIAADAAARKANQLQTANICREVLTDAVFEKIKERNSNKYEKS
jgi:hypothetical protein